MMLSILLMIVSLILFTLISIIGLIYTTIKALIRWNFSRLKLINKQGFIQSKLFFVSIAISFDEYGNVYCGELLSYACSFNKPEDTLFMQSDTTISAALGHIESTGKFTKFGYALRSLLNRTFEPNHCLNAYEYLLRYREVKKTNEFNNWVND